MFGLIIKGLAMGAANVIPGVSGGTIAFISGIYERLIDSLKSINTVFISYLFKFKFIKALEYIDYKFLFPIFLGVIISIFSFAKLFEYLFINYKILTWSFFFGLIIASVFLIIKEIKVWKFFTILSFVIGLGVAIFIAIQKPVSENHNLFYLFLCGLVGFCSMVVPGISGAFVLVLMGNYLLIISKINEFRKELTELNIKEVINITTNYILPIGIGVIVGFIIFSRLLSWLFKHFHDATIALLAGFTTGSLLIIWPWKDEIYLKDNLGKLIYKKGERIIQGYDWYLPDFSVTSSWLAILCILFGIFLVILFEKLSPKQY